MRSGKVIVAIARSQNNNAGAARPASEQHREKRHVALNISSSVSRREEGRKERRGCGMWSLIARLGERAFNLKRLFFPAGIKHRRPVWERWSLIKGSGFNL